MQRKTKYPTGRNNISKVSRSAKIYVQIQNLSKGMIEHIGWRPDEISSVHSSGIPL